MARYQIILAYDGTEFFGFQRLASGSQNRTVQGVLEAALRKIGWLGASILAAGRTDGGVHASGQVAAFDLEWRHNLSALRAALNANLPPDVVVKDVCLARADFHPRYDALARCYHYRIFCQPVRDPLLERYAWRVWPGVQIEKLHRSAEQFLGEHDFAAFGTPPRTGGSTIRTVFQAFWQEDPTGLTFIVRANAFLYHMVRRMVGLQIDIAQELEDVSAVSRRLEPASSGPEQQNVQGLVRRLAPPQGLTLVEVTYPGEKHQEYCE
jgi:tRNA pseudouridine38-40 synthase